MNWSVHQSYSYHLFISYSRSKIPERLSYKMYIFYSIIYYGILVILGLISIICMYLTMKTFTEIENYFLTSAIIFIHILTILFTLLFEIILILILSLLNATFLQLLDSNSIDD
jgi:hypothetical protein